MVLRRNHEAMLRRSSAAQRLGKVILVGEAPYSFGFRSLSQCVSIFINVAYKLLFHMEVALKLASTMSKQVAASRPFQEMTVS